MQPIAIDVAWSTFLYVCLSVNRVLPLEQKDVCLMQFNSKSNVIQLPVLQ